MMIERKLYDGISKIAWGYFLLYCNINIAIGGFTVNVLPSFAGFLLFLSAIGLLCEEERELSLLRIPCIVLAVWNGVQWGLDMFGVQTNEVLRIVDFICVLLNLYFHFQLLTNMAGIAEKYQPEDVFLNRKLLQCRTAQTVALTVIFVLTRFQPWLGEVWAYISVLILIAYLAVCFYMMHILFRLRKCIRVPQTDEQGEHGETV